MDESESVSSRIPSTSESFLMTTAQTILSIPVSSVRPSRHSGLDPFCSNTVDVFVKSPEIAMNLLFNPRITFSPHCVQMMPVDGFARAASNMECTVIPTSLA